MATKPETRYSKLLALIERSCSSCQRRRAKIKQAATKIGKQARDLLRRPRKTS